MGLFIGIALASSSANAASPLIQVTVASYQALCGSDVDYRVRVFSNQSKKDFRDTTELRKLHPRASQIATQDNFDKRKSLGEYLVIVSSNVPMGQCERFTYGVGFGRDKDQATERALQDLKKRAPKFDEGRDGYKTEMAKAYSADEKPSR